MKKLELLMPMDLQFFAEEPPADENGTDQNQSDPNGKPAAEDNPDDLDEKDLDSEKVVEKLQKRLASKTAAEKETKTQLEQALARIDELEKGSKKGVKELSDEEKAAKEQSEKDAEIEKLRNQIKIAESTQQADEVLKEAGLVAGKDLLSMIVRTDDEKTLANVKALINYTNEQQKQWEIKRNTGTTPKKTPGSKEIDPFKAVLDKY
ncbi:DUF4355 domain-containing protein [Enterococcus hirae]|nr:DUF4355 domain-containing protein [Enterococcus hirae]